MSSFFDSKKKNKPTKNNLVIINIIMKYFNTSSHIRYSFIKLCAYITMGIFTFIFREPLVQNLKFFIGGLMVIYGLEEVIYEVYFFGKDFWKRERIFLGFLEILFGAVLIFSPLTIPTVCIIWASWSIVREAFEIRELVVVIRSWTLSIIYAIESVAIIVLSVMLILEPGEHHAMIHLYLLLVELLLNPLVPLLDEIMIEKNKEKNEEEH